MAESAPDWFHDAIVSGLQGLVALRLEGGPPRDSVAATALTWVAAWWALPVAWVKSDVDRIAHAFLRATHRVTKWPAPRDVINLMPPRPAMLALPEIAPGPEVLERRREALRQWVLREYDDSRGPLTDGQLLVRDSLLKIADKME